MTHRTLIAFVGLAAAVLLTLLMSVLNDMSKQTCFEHPEVTGCDRYINELRRGTGE